jgi:nucleotide-binding universal stress UspA family protein
MTSTIIVGIDRSTPSRIALRWGVERAAATGAEVLLVHVIDDYTVVDELPRYAREFIEAQAEYARSLSISVDIRTQLLRGSPMWELAAVPRMPDWLWSERTKRASSTAKCSARAACS